MINYEYTICDNDTIMEFNHASSIEIPNPLQAYTQTVTNAAQLRDFGLGFYTCVNDYEHSLKSVSANKDNKTLVLNKYAISLKGLKLVELTLDIEWLLLISFHREDFDGKAWCHPLRDRCRMWLSGFDVVAGVISNDKTYEVIEDYIQNRISDEAALSMLNAANCGKQYTFKSSVACERLQQGFLSAIHFTEAERMGFRTLYNIENKQYAEEEEILREQFRYNQLHNQAYAQ
jgi:hypothetical protein